MPGIQALTKLQLGRETTAGTLVAATTIWRGKGRGEEPSNIVFPEEDIGFVSGVDRTYEPKVEAKLKMEETEATFEQLPHLLEAGVETDAPAQDGAGTGYIYEYELPTTAVMTPKTYTIEGGDDAGAERAGYGFVEKLVLSGEGGGPVKMQADWILRQWAPNAFTGSLALPTVEEILFSKAKLYADAVGGTIGATQLTNTWLDFNLELNTGFMGVWTGDGNKYFSFRKGVAPELVLKATFEHETQSIAEKASYRAGTARKLRLLFVGNALGTAGVHATKKVIVDMAGKWEKFEALGVRNGNNIIAATFRARYNSTAALFATITVVNELTALP